MNYFTECMSAPGQGLVFWELCYWQVRAQYYTSTVIYSCGKIFVIYLALILSSIDPRLVRHLCEASHVLPICIHTVISCTVMYRAILHPVIQYSWAEWRLIVPYWIYNACTLLYSHTSGWILMTDSLMKTFMLVHRYDLRVRRHRLWIKVNK